MVAKSSTPSIADVLKDAAKKYDLRVGSLSQIAEDCVALTTGNLAIDHITGVGGLPLGRSIELYGRPSSGKSLDLDALVLTPDRGFVRMGDIRLGDLVVDPEGASSLVTGVFPQGALPVYRLTFSDGSSATSSGDHLWSVSTYDSGGRANLPGEWVSKVMTAYDLRARCARQRPRVRLPRIQAVDFMEDALEVDPYLLGMLLGDGCLTGKGIRFGSMDSQLIDACRDALPDGIKARYVSSDGKCDWYGLTGGQRGGTLNPLTASLRRLGVMGSSSYTKFVPESYKVSSAKTRLAVLQGLMDTDGNWATGSAEFSSASEQLRDDVVWLARSLGLTARVGEKETSYTYLGEKKAGHTAYRAFIRETEGIRVFRLDRKLGPIGSRDSRQLVSVEYIGEKECQCISVSAPSELYVTNDFIPTHNTTTALQAAAELQRRIISEGLDEYILYSDYEHALDNRYAKALGLDTDHPSFLFTQPDNFEQGANVARSLIETGKVRLAIWDSVAAMTPSAALDAETGKASIALQARLMSDFLKVLNPLLHQQNCAAVFLNHEMELINMGGGGRPGFKSYSTPGGRALKYYASVRIEYKPIGNIKAAAVDVLSGETIEKVDASTVKVKVVKNKVAPPFQECLVRVRFGRGFDNFWTAMQVLVGNKKVKYSAGYYYFNDLPSLVIEDMPRTTTDRPYIRGEENLMAFADSHPEWRSDVVKWATELVASSDELVSLVAPEDDEDTDSPKSLLGGSDVFGGEED